MAKVEKMEKMSSIIVCFARYGEVNFNVPSWSLFVFSRYIRPAAVLHVEYSIFIGEYQVVKEKKTITLVSRGLVFRTQTFMCNDNFEALVRALLVRHYKKCS